MHLVLKALYLSLAVACMLLWNN